MSPTFAANVAIQSLPRQGSFNIAKSIIGGGSSLKAGGVQREPSRLQLISSPVARGETIVSPSNRVLASGIERFVNRKIDTGIHMIKQIKCKNENFNKIEISAAKKVRAEKQKSIREDLRESFEKEKHELFQFARSRERSATIVETYHRQIQEAEMSLKSQLYRRIQSGYAGSTPHSSGQRGDYSNLSHF